MIRACFLLSLLGFVPSAQAFSGTVTEDMPGLQRGSRYLLAKPVDVPMREDGVYRIAGELRADAPGWAVVGPNDYVSGKPHFYRMCPIAVSTNWTPFVFEIHAPEKVEVLSDGMATMAVGWERGEAITRLDYRDLTVRELPCPKGVRAEGWWERSATNGFFNSSFELGLASHDVCANTAYAAAASRPEVTIDETTAWHGTRSLRIDNRKFVRMVEFVSSAGACDAKPGPLTVSCYAKADRPVKATLRARDILYDAARGKMDFLGAHREVEIGMDWTRLELSLGNRKAMHGKCALFLSFEDPAVVWLDAIQVENGKKSTPFAPAAPVEAAYVPDRSVFVLSPEAPATNGTGRLVAVNYTADAQLLRVTGERIHATLPLSPNAAAETAVMFPVTRYGAFSLKARFSCAAGSGRLFEADCAVCAPVAPWRGGFAMGLNAAAGCVNEGAVPETARNSFCLTGGVSLEDHYRHLALSGCRILRLHDCGIWWQTLEPKPGVRDWATLDAVVDQCEKNGLKVMFVFGNGKVTSVHADKPDPLANWFVRKRSVERPSGWGKAHRCFLPHPDDWRDFYTALVRRYRGRIAYYEVVNEPNGTMADPDDYLRYLKLSYEIVRENDPSAKVVGICSTGDYGSNTAGFIAKIGEKGGFSYFDILSFHPYDARLDVTRKPAERQFEEIRALVDRFAPRKPILEDELYYLSTAPEHEIQGRPRDDPGLSENWPDGHVVRRLVLDLAGGSVASLPITFRQLVRVGPDHRGSMMHQHTLHRFNPNGRFVACNAFARFLNDATFVGKPCLPSDENGYLFRDRDGRRVVVRWMRRVGAEREIRLEPGVQAYDLYGNRLTGSDVRLTSEPVYLLEAVTVGENGYPVYDAAPLPAYVESALTPPEKAELAARLPERVAAGERRLAELESAGTNSVRFVRIAKRLAMARRLCDYIRVNCAKGTVSGLCSAESGEACLQAFLLYFDREFASWKHDPEAPGVTAQVFNVKDFGAKGDGVTDDEPAFQAAFAKVRSLKGAPSVLRIPSGAYVLMAKRSENPHDTMRHVQFARIDNCLIAGESAETTHLVLGDYDGDGIDFRDWVNSTLRDVQVYWRENPFVEGEVESVDRADGSLVLRHHEGTLKPNDPRFARIGYPNSCMQFDRDGTPIKRPVLWYDYRCEDLGGGRYRLHFDPEQGSTKTMPVEPGAIFVFPDRNNRIAALRANGSSFFTFDRVWVRNSRAGAFSPGGSYQPTLVNCRVFPKDPRFCLSTNADGNFTSPGTCIIGCDFTNMNDDGSNAHNSGKIFYACDADTGAYEHDSNWQWEQPGDFAVVISSLDGRYYRNTRVKSVRIKPENRQRQQTVFEDALPPEVRSYASLGITPYDPLTRRKIYLGTLKTSTFPDQFYVPYNQGVGYICSGNRFANIRGVAVQVQTPNSLVESNEIVNVYRGIELSGLLHYQEGPPPYNVVIRGNRITNVNRGIKASFMTLNHPAAVTTPMGRLLIEDNRIVEAAESPLMLANVEDTLVRNNVFAGPRDIKLEVCRGVTFVGNVRDGRPFGTAETVRAAHCAAIELQDGEL